MTTALTEYPGLEAKAQKVFDMPYSELALHFQKAVRSLVAKEAAEEMLDALHQAKLQIEYLHDKFRITGTGNAVLAHIDNAIKKASGQ